ncbi:MAG: hypothetical protein K2N68_00860, partial [Clostridia bacterium]|nr:hypothetical protein [Clostridia bacterium]
MKSIKAEKGAAVPRLKQNKKNTKAGDIPLLICVFLMSCFGCLCIYSASSYAAEVQFGDGLY